MFPDHLVFDPTDGDAHDLMFYIAIPPYSPDYLFFHSRLVFLLDAWT